MSFSTYATPTQYTDPVNVKILEPNPVGDLHPETQRIEPPIKPLLKDFLDAQTAYESFQMASSADKKISATYLVTFFLIIFIGMFYIFQFYKLIGSKDGSRPKSRSAFLY